jgi:hypothetical protein
MEDQMSLITDDIDIIYEALDSSGTLPVSFVARKNSRDFRVWFLRSHDWAAVTRVERGRESLLVKACTRAEPIATMIGWFSYIDLGQHGTLDSPVEPGMSLDCPAGTRCIVESLESGDLSKTGLVRLGESDDALPVVVRISRINDATSVELWASPARRGGRRSALSLQAGELRPLRAGSPLRLLEITAPARTSDALLVAMAAAVEQKVFPYIELPSRPSSDTDPRLWLVAASSVVSARTR